MIGLKELLDDAKSGNFAARIVITAGLTIIIGILVLAARILFIVNRGG